MLVSFLKDSFIQRFVESENLYQKREKNKIGATKRETKKN